MKKLHIATLLATAFGFLSLTPQASPATPVPNSLGAQSYAKHCAICHGEHREGILPGFPPLLDIKRQASEQQIEGTIHTGKGRMPAFPKLQNEELTALLHFLATDDLATTTTPVSNSLAETGRHIFLRNCAFCHGRDAAGGETGPDLTRSKLVLSDKNGSKITEVVQNGRPDKKMPAFNFSAEEFRSIVAFIHQTEAQASAHPGGRRGVDVADLQTGNAEAGRQYFNGAGGCSKCHSATGDLAGIAARFEGLRLEEQMLYPKNAKSRVTVTLPSGEKITGFVAYHDEFTIGLRDGHGTYHSWPANRVHYVVDAPVEAHVELFSKYTDDDIHNLMAYLQNLR